jgi:5,10-methylenetetrahydromethanopterin reductase
MRIGIFGGEGTVAELVAMAMQVEADGFDSFWLPQIFGVDALCTHTLIAHEVPRIELGTAVVPTYPRHPSVLAAQAMTVSQVSDGRFTLGIGLSHQIVIEHMLGYSFDRPAHHMEEYLQAIGPLLRGQAADVSGDTLSAHLGLQLDAPTVPLLVAALGPKMLRLAAQHAAGTVTWMTGPKTLSEHTVPTITAACTELGTDAPRVVGALPVAVTDDADDAKAKAAKVFQIYGQLPSYRAMLDREGADGPADVALIGTAAEVEAGVGRMRDAGVTDFVAVEFHPSGSVFDDTRELLKGLV